MRSTQPLIIIGLFSITSFLLLGLLPVELDTRWANDFERISSSLNAQLNTHVLDSTQREELSAALSINQSFIFSFRVAYQWACIIGVLCLSGFICLPLFLPKKIAVPSLVLFSLVGCAAAITIRTLTRDMLTGEYWAAQRSFLQLAHGGTNGLLAEAGLFFFEALFLMFTQSSIFDLIKSEEPEE